MTKKKESTDKLTAAVAGIDTEALRGSLAKDQFVQFRATKEEKKSLSETADSLNLTVSQYLLTIHSLVEKRLNRKLE